MDVGPRKRRGRLDSRMSRRGILLVCLMGVLVALFMMKTSVLRFVADRMGIVAADEKMIDMSQYEALADRAPYEQFLNKGNETVKVRPAGENDDTNSILLTIYRIKSMQIRTEDSPVGVMNTAFAVVDEKVTAPSGKIFRYGLRDIVRSRKYSKKIGVKFVSKMEAAPS